MSVRRPALACAPILLAVAAAAGATTIEIGPGDDFRGAMQGLAAGDTLILHGGTYTLTSYFALELVGTAERPITIRAAAGERPLLHYVDASQNVVNVQNSAFVTFDGLEFSGGSRGIRLTASSDVAIRDCHVHDTADNAISANDAGGDYARLTFVHDEIDHTGGTGEGFYLGCNEDACRVHDSLVADNYVHDLVGPSVSQGDGIEIKDGSYANVVRDNVIHDTGYPAITLYSTRGNGAPNRIERNLIWNAGDNGIQVGADAIVRNNVVLGAAAAGIGVNAAQGVAPGDLAIVGNTVLKASGDALHLSGIAGTVTVANNALYAPGGNAVFASGATALVALVANVGTGSLAGVSGGFDASGDVGADFFGASYSGRPPQNVVPRGDRLVGRADAATIAADDFDGVPRGSQLDVGAYRARADGEPGWPLQAGFKTLVGIFADGFETPAAADARR